MRPKGQRCIDCGRRTNIAKTVGGRESYMVHDSVWFAAGMPKREPNKTSADFLCIGCLEARLGRKLMPSDFTGAPINRPDRLNSQRLNSRLTGRDGPG
jgi:hypothetical protein